MALTVTRALGDGHRFSSHPWSGAHFKSQSGGGGPKRKRRAAEVRQIVNRLVGEGKHVIVLGDLNEGDRPPKKA